MIRSATTGEDATARRPDVRALGGGAATALAGWCVAVVLVLLAGLAVPRASAGVGEVLGAGSLLWLVLGGARLHIGEGVLALTPLLGPLLLVLAARTGARRLLPEAPDLRLQGAWLGGYAGVGLLAALLGLLSPVGPGWLSLLLPLVVLPALGLALAHGLPEPLLERWEQAPLSLRRGLLPGAKGTAALLVLGAALVVVATLIHIGRVAHIQSQLDAGIFGGLLLVPTYLQQVRGEDTLHAGLLLAPQGLGAMVTMPIAGYLADKYPVGRIVPFGIAIITGGMFALTQISDDTSYWGYLIPVLFVMGLGMGMTMMPLMTSALKTLTAHQVARGSTTLNIVQQVASSFGVSVISVLLVNAFNARPLIGQAQAFGEESAKAADPSATGELLARFPEVAKVLAGITDPGRATEVLMAAVRSDMAAAFASTYWAAGGLCLIAAAAIVTLSRPQVPAPEPVAARA